MSRPFNQYNGENSLVRDDDDDLTLDEIQEQLEREQEKADAKYHADKEDGI